LRVRVLLLRSCSQCSKNAVVVAGWTATANKLGAVPPAVAQFVTTALAQHQMQLEKWNGVLTAAGSPAVTEPNATLKPVVEAAFAKVTVVIGAANLALMLERIAAAPYLSAQKLLIDKGAIKLACSIQIIEAEHVAVLLFVLGQYPVLRRVRQDRHGRRGISTAGHNLPPRAGRRNPDDRLDGVSGSVGEARVVTEVQRLRRWSGALLRESDAVAAEAEVGVGLFFEVTNGGAAQCGYRADGSDVGAVGESRRSAPGRAASKSCVRADCLASFAARRPRYVITPANLAGGVLPDGWSRVRAPRSTEATDAIDHGDTQDQPDVSPARGSRLVIRSWNVGRLGAKTGRGFGQAPRAFGVVSP